MEEQNIISSYLQRNLPHLHMIGCKIEGGTHQYLIYKINNTVYLHVGNGADSVSKPVQSAIKAAKQIRFIEEHGIDEYVKYF